MIAEIDLLIRQGKANEARGLFLSLDLTESSRPERVPLAQLARRLNLPTSILKLLAPIVRPVVINHLEPATTEEKALYAVGLTRLGAYQEAKKVLARLNPEDFTQVFLFRAHVAIFHWDYDAAIPLLKSYIKVLQDPYQLIVARLNLAAAYLHTARYAEFLEINDQIIEEAKEKKLTLILGNSLELLSQYLILTRDYLRADETLKYAETIFVESALPTQFYVKKWRAILDFLKNKNFDAGCSLQDLRAECHARKDYETLRECDFYEAWATGDMYMHHRVFQGTPLVGYRKKMKKLLSARIKQPKSFRWDVPLMHLTSVEETSAVVFNLGRSVALATGDSLSNQPKLHQLLQFLCRDFYKPSQIGEVFYHLYPDEYYSWETSPTRILQLVKRLRWWFRENQIALTIHLEKSNLFLRATQPISLEIEPDQKIQNRVHVTLGELKNAVSASAFTADDVSRALDLSPRSARRLLQKAKQEGLIKGGRGTGHKTFSFVRPEQESA